MKYLIDTNVISETTRKYPDIHVQNWFQRVPSTQLYISVLTLGEIRRGIEKLKDQTRKNSITVWLENDLMSWFGDRILPISIEIAEKWGYLTSLNTPTFPAIDCLLVATALTHNMKLVTRNTADFQKVPGLELFNPWDFYQ